MAIFSCLSRGNTVLVYTADQVYYPGSQVSGSVLVNIATPMEAAGVFLKLCGKESTFWEEHETRYRTETYTTRDANGHTSTHTRSVAYTVTVTYSGNHIIFKQEVPLMPGGYLKAGQYTIPYSFVLPPYLPGSASFGGSDGGCRYHGSIEYSVKAVVRDPSFFRPNLRYRQEFLVPHFPPVSRGCILGISRSEIKVGCCINKGHADIQFRCPRDVVNPGEILDIVTSVQNSSTSKLRKMKVKLVANITLTSSGGRKFYTTETPVKCVYPGLEPHTNVEDMKLTLQVPFGTQHEVVGNIIRYIHCVTVAGSVRCGKDAHCSVPVHITANQPTQAGALGIPIIDDPSWQPSIMAPVVVPEPTAPSLPPPVPLNAYPDYESMQPSAPVDDDAITAPQQIQMK
jgi:hypothetical protein